ncbi:DUF2798 domain-containing protein [Streptococcus respiraculi]|uniref:DUF2798 domain-containing protein n=1 Tax=Streptococcus respiraculi TaxID=2021971 RepID=UPI000E732F97|nr:DUF2798 domain-containing protein [Streptococcus respiraculi]
MPKNFKEALLFTTLMCGLMVFGMSCWNLFLVGQFSLSHVLTGFAPAFLVAFALDMLLVGPLAKKLAFRLLSLSPAPVKDWQKILIISGTIGLFMVSLMSFYGLIMNGVPLSFGTYGLAWMSNAVMALPLNFFVAGPLARFFFGKLVVFLYSKPEAV